MLNRLAQRRPSLNPSNFVSAGRQLEHRLVAEKEALEGARALKSALMSVLLTGEVRVKPDEGAPA